MRLKRSFDYKRINEIMTHPGVYPYISDDGSPTRNKFITIQSPEVYYLLWKGGVFMYVPINGITVEVHTCVLPKFQGKSLPYAKASIKWIFNNTTYKKIMTHVPQNNRKAFVYAKKAGMVEEGYLTNSFMLNGEIMGQHILGVSCQQQQ